MNKPKTIIICGALVFLLCGLFPPWLYTISGPYAARSERSAGFNFLFNAPEPKIGISHGITLDTPRLAVEWLCVLAVTGALWVFGFRKED
jgi:hypothetical protein